MVRKLASLPFTFFRSKWYFRKIPLSKLVIEVIRKRHTPERHLKTSENMGPSAQPAVPEALRNMDSMASLAIGFESCCARLFPQ